MCRSNILTLIVLVMALFPSNVRAEEDARSVVAWLKSKGVRVETNLFGIVQELLLATIEREVKWTDADLLRLKSLKGLRKLSLAGAYYSQEALEKLAEFPNLTELELSGALLGDDPKSKFTDEHLKAIGKLKALKSLGIAYGQSITTLESLSGLTELESIDVPGIQMRDAGFKSIAALKKLKSIKMSFSEITDLAPLAGLTALESLELSGAPITDAGLKPIAGLKSLTKLDLQEAKITDASLAVIGGFSELKDLNLSLTPISDLKPIAGLTKLRLLELARTKINDESLKNLASMKSLVYLRLNGTAISDIAVLRDLTNLTSIYLEETQIDDADLENLTGFKKNERGELLIGDRGKVTKMGIEKLQKLYPRKYVY